MVEETNATAQGEVAGGDTTAISNQEGQKELKTYTEDEVNKLIQSEADRRVNSAINKQREKWVKEYEAKLENEKNEAARLATMSVEERKEAELKKDQEKFELERKKYQVDRLKFETTKQLSEKGLPIEFAQMLCDDSAETTKANIDVFEAKFAKAVQTEIEKRLKGRTPTVPAQTPTTISQKQFNKMSYGEKVELYNNNKSEYERLIGGY